MYALEDKYEPFILNLFPYVLCEQQIRLSLELYFKLHNSIKIYYLFISIIIRIFSILVLNIKYIFKHACVRDFRIKSNFSRKLLLKKKKNSLEELII